MHFSSKYSLLLSLCFCMTSGAFSQQSSNRSYSKIDKPAVDLRAVENWAFVSSGKISNDGKYVSYTIYNETPGKNKLVVQSTNSKWKTGFHEGSSGMFSEDSHYYIFSSGKDSVKMLQLGSDQVEIIPDAGNYFVSNSQSSTILAYRIASEPRTLKIRTLTLKKEWQYSNVITNQFSTLGNYLIVQQKMPADSITSIKIVNLSSTLENIIWAGNSSENILRGVFCDAEDRQLVMLLEHPNGVKKNYSFYYYNIEKGQGSMLLSNFKISSKFPGMELAGSAPQFSKDGKKIFFGLRTGKKELPKEDAVKLDVWSYNDNELQTVQLENAKRENVYSAVIDITSKRIAQLENDLEKVAAQTNNFVLLEKRLGLRGMFEAGWNKAARFSYYLLSLKDNSKKILKEGVINSAESMRLSPTGRWLTYYDFDSKNYFCIETATGNRYNITNGSNTVWEDEENDYPEASLAGYPIWIKNDDALFIYDNHDIWLLDPYGKRKPINWTNGFGARNGIRFKFIDNPATIQQYALEKQPQIFLYGFNKQTKDRGYFTKRLGADGDPSMHCMGPYVYGSWDVDYLHNFPPVKAKNVNVYLDVRCSATEAPNYFVTSDYKNFNFLTDIQPQKDFNWYTTELHSWKSLDGKLLHGILYKPENFDSSKKYPVIFQYYEKRSEELNLFIAPAASKSEINIPLFVSQGYLVFVPDIEYAVGHPGESAYNSVVSAANYMAKLPFVDSKKMGLQGHSFGGYETGYIITHTNLFAAACSASGFYDLISWYGSAARGGYPIYSCERSQTRMGSTPWDEKDLYIKNSPIFFVDKVKTPLLMMQNRDDKSAPFAQGLEFFTSLRRLGKVVWMLQYDDEGHSLDAFGSAAKDYHKRMLQFFDYYLKCMQMPQWMSNGIPAKLKGLEDGFALGKK